MVARTANVVRVTVLDISRSDARSDIIAQQDLRNIPVPAGNGVETIVFLLEDVQSLKTGADLTIAIHVDWAGSGEIESGDFITTRTYPVDLSRDHQDFEIIVERV